MLRVILLTAISGALNAQESSPRITNPFNTDADRAEGARLFLSQCASCHGRDARGGQGTPDLTTGSFKRATSDEAVIQILVKGIPGTTMPGFGFNGRENWQLLAYLRSLAVARMNTNVSGDAARGAALYARYKCGGCHESGRAPSLSEAGKLLTPEEIRRAITDPQADVGRDWWRFRATTKDGRTLTGRRLNEDTYTIQFADERGQLRSIAKETLAHYETLRDSPMPSFRGKLTAGEIDDLLAFVVKGAPK